MHLRDDFNANGPVSQVPASWFNRVAKFINGLIPGEGIEFSKRDDGGDTVIKLAGGGSRGTPTGAGEFPTDEVDQAEQTLWQSGGENGADLLVLFKGEKGSFDTHDLFAARLEITSDGRISKIVAAPNTGVYIGA